MFPCNADPIERPIRQRNFAQHVPILRHPQHHAMFQPRAEHHMGHVKISAGIIHPKRCRAHHRPIDLHRRPSRRTRHAKRLRPRQRHNRRERRDQRRHPNHRRKHPPPASPVRHHQQPPRGKPAHCHRNVKPSMRTNTHAPRKSPSNFPQPRKLPGPQRIAIRRVHDESNIDRFASTVFAVIPLALTKDETESRRTLPRRRGTTLRFRNLRQFALT